MVRRSRRYRLVRASRSQRSTLHLQCVLVVLLLRFGQVAAKLTLSALQEDVDEAVQAANQAFKTTWRKTPPAEKAKLMHKLADLVDEHAQELAVLEALDAGMMLAMASGFEIPFLSKALRKSSFKLQLPRLAN